MKLLPRAQKVVQDCSFAGDPKIDDGLSQSCWANMPSELLREVLVKIEESESKWPLRKNVVACAGVCRSWREIMKEVVQIPHVSGKITFPISVKQPGPRHSLLQCFIKRNNSTQTYNLYLSLSQALADDGKFLMAARRVRRPTCTDYVISLRADDMSKDSKNYVGKLSSNFLGTKFVVYDAFQCESGNNNNNKLSKSRSVGFRVSKQASRKAQSVYNAVAHVSYELNVLGARGPRRMHCVLDTIPSSAIKCLQHNIPLSNNVDYFSSFTSSSSNPRLTTSMSGPLAGPQEEAALVLKNKAPRWHGQLHCWCLNFHGRVTVASVKNFQLVASPEPGSQPGPVHEKVILQFGKVGKDAFTMDYRYPLSAFQAFAICLSSFDTKIACE